MDELKVRLHWMMGLRVVVVSLLLGVSIFFQSNRDELVDFYSALIIFTYAITIAYVLAFRRLTTLTALSRFALLQFGVDLLLETLLVGRTGGIDSQFSVLYVITVALASFILSRRGGVLTAAVSVILFGLLTNMQLYGLMDSTGWLPRSRLSVWETFHTFSLQSLALIVVGLLSGTLAEQLRRADESLVEKDRGLSRLQAFHQNVVQSISSGVFTTDATGRITSFNRAAQEITGHPPEAVLSRLWWEVFAWEQGDLFGTEPATLTEPYRFEAEGKRVDGSRLVLGMTLTPLTEQGAQTGLVGVFRDLTQIRDLEEEMRRREWLATLGEISAGMAHEIRNPLAALGGAMQMLRRDLPKDETSSRLMDIAIRETDRLDGIIHSFLQYARPPALNLKECDLNTVLKEALDLIRHSVRSRQNLEIVTHLANGALTAQVDPDQMKQVFWNLATNAFQAMPAGGRLTIATGVRKVMTSGKPGEVIEIAFEDTGEGVRKDVRDKIFLPFVTTKHDGSGLGLPTVHRIVDLHGGWVRVASETGKGARFVVCLPRTPEAGLQVKQQGREPWKKS
jgi:two-component system sensor histidine kinase PilS (NtrC family)